MSKRILSALCAASILASAVVAAGPRTLRSVEDAAESVELDISLSSEHAGRVVARLCDSCELLTLQVDANTAVFLQGARTTLRVAAERKAQGATVFFDHETLVVKRIVLWD